MRLLSATTLVQLVACIVMPQHLIAAKTRHSAVAKVFRAELVEPGRTLSAQLKDMLGKPIRVVREGPTREFYFYDLGAGSTMDATVYVKSGVVQYVTYLCDESMPDVKTRFSGEPSIHKTVSTAESGYRSALSQVLYESKGRGFVYDSKTFKIKACVAWEPGKKFEELSN